MTSRESIILLISAVLSLLCYQRASHNRYASAIAEVMGEIDTNFVQPIDHRILFEGSVRGMTRELDDYSGYIPPDRYAKLLEDIDQEFGGIGIVVDVDDDSERLMVVTPVLDTPAQRAGLRAGDLIMAVNGKDTKGMDANDSVMHIRGEPGSEVTLTIQSRGETDTKDVVLERAVIPVHSVLGDRRLPDGSWTYVVEDEPDIGYIRLVSFGENSASDLKAAMQSVIPDVKALILDLRGNGGGLLQASVEICDMFIDNGLIVSVKGRAESDQSEYKATSPLVVPKDLPLVVLVDHYSASASEITSACLQDHERATIIGERTWGKGTVQSLIELEGGASALRLTTATYWRPSGQNIHRLAQTKPEDDWGVTPDAEFLVKYTDEYRLDVMRARRKRDGDVLGPSSESPHPPDNETAVEEPETNEDDSAGDEAAAEESDEPVVDKQLNKAIDHLRKQIDGASDVEPEDAETKKAA